jgi:hypothetical protein
MPDYMQARRGSYGAGKLRGEGPLYVWRESFAGTHRIPQSQHERRGKSRGSRTEKVVFHAGNGNGIGSEAGCAVLPFLDRNVRIVVRLEDIRIEGPA